MTKNKKWWKVSVPVLLVGNVVLILMLLGSARPEEPKDASKREVRFEAVEIPEKASFAGESLPLDRFYVKEALDRELLSNAYFHSQTIRLIKLAPRYFPIIEPILKEEGIHDDFKYLAVAESGFNPRAISPASAAGFWQFMKGTAGDYGLEVNSEVDERYHIEKATRAACDYLKDAYEKFGSWTLVAASYNRGMTGVQRQMDIQRQDDYYDLLITTETARYVYRIMALKLILENPEKYNFYVADKDKYPVIPTKQVEITGSVANFADYAKEQGLSYKVFKDFNPWLRENTLTYSGKKRYWVEIPQL
ncbi:lytic transglycosylase domain-containing protein [Maribellus sp. CM-23]|uniref:lytic transglycosylase domain-containing protein n=1 Tax=Maribellus sp. CM-23 TaxID=2781026 RepID=UPI001F2D5BCF|nr:lytic transglycosylase domain-containing protein [Maribellus sp. CM-23]MCE4564539.1 lytic transglycosylase domain-containing protein [Maribellus sp. CM-23]